MRMSASLVRCAALWLCSAIYGLAQANDAVSFEPSVVLVKGPRNRIRSVDRAQTSPNNVTTPIDKNPTVRNFTIIGDNFTMDGQPFQIISGSLHYFRVPAVYWKDRLHKLKAAGLNTVSTYVEWSFHEPEERQYSFEGDRDVAAFIRLAAEENLHVLLRPGPYICAERDLGGFPYWLLGKYPDISLRSTKPDFLDETKTWLEKLFEQLNPLLFGNGGPIILVQVENEYGSYGDDMAYKIQMRDIMLKHVGNKAVLYTTDGSWEYFYKNGATPGVLTTIDFGATTNVWKWFTPLRRYMPHGPLMNSEYYPGWLTHWGERLQQVPTHAVVATLEDMLNNSINVNIYVFFGGTNFEFTAGANQISTYLPDITSYDYDAPLNEAGDPTPKYFAIRDVLARHNPQVRDIDPPKPSNKSAYGKISLDERFRLLSPVGRSSLGKKYLDVIGSKLPTFEKLRQRAGLMLYETTPGEVNQGSILQINGPRDRIHVYVDGRYRGTISRTQKIYSLPVETKANSVLSLLVENQGRINYGSDIHDFKGILREVTINRKVLNGSWSVTGFPLQTLDGAASATTTTKEDAEVEGPILFDGYFTIPENQQPQDTFFDTTTWGKGYIWVNGYNLGRYWPGIGPQVTLYVPGCWLRAGRNHVQLLELDQAPASRNIQSIDYPILNRTAESI